MAESQQNDEEEQEEPQTRTLTCQDGAESTSYNVSNNQSEIRLPLKGLRNDYFTSEESNVTETERTTPIIARSWAVIPERD